MFDKGFDINAFKLLVLSKHYRTEGNFTWEILEAAQNRLNNWRAAIDLLWQEDKAKDSAIQDDQVEKELLGALQEELNTPNALTIIDKVVDEIEQLHLCKPCIENMATSIKKLLGIDLMAGKSDITNDQKEILKQRQTARDNKDWAKSDELRDQLAKENLTIRDTDQGQIWNRTI